MTIQRDLGALASEGRLVRFSTNTQVTYDHKELLANDEVDAVVERMTREMKQC